MGAAQTVTGSRTLLSYGGKRYLVDCGLFQGPKDKRLLNWEPFQDADKIDAVILTHAHIDHSGYLPKLVKEGFKGPIYCSEGTADLCEILLLDSAYLQEEDAKFANKTKHSRHDPALPLYTTHDAERALKQIKPVARDKWIQLAQGLSFIFKQSGHIIGSSFIQFNYQVENGSRLITFSGDIGNGRSEILRPPVAIQETDYLVLESTYGNRIQSRTDPGIILGEVINQVFEQKGVLVIPAFSVGRTQEILYYIRKLEDAGIVPKLPVFVDSPMANHATEVYLAHPEDHGLVFREGGLQPPICSTCYEAVKSVDESMMLCMRDGPIIVISAAGMLTGGRILHHLKHRLPDSKNIVLFVGFQAAETKGRLLQEGIIELQIHHQVVPVEAKIVTLDSLSAHADADDIMAWLKRFSKMPTKIFINHGELPASQALMERITKELGIECHIPNYNEMIDLGK